MTAHFTSTYGRLFLWSGHREVRWAGHLGKPREGERTCPRAPFTAGKQETRVSLQSYRSTGAVVDICKSGALVTQSSRRCTSPGDTPHPSRREAQSSGRELLFGRTSLTEQRKNLDFACFPSLCSCQTGPILASARVKGSTRCPPLGGQVPKKNSIPNG